ncbi:hypothetical protein BGX26_003976 [Mortierella sp. AD094]|nr:hypothetical protein BGX26_003976 [Mortierella sp. AD094]
MAVWYCVLAWQVDTTGANTQEDIEKALQSRRSIGDFEEREPRSASSPSFSFIGSGWHRLFKATGSEKDSTVHTFCLGSNSNSGSRGIRSGGGVEDVSYGRNELEGEDDIIDGLAVGEDAEAFVVVTQANQANMQSPKEDAEKQLELVSSASQSSLPSYTTIRYLEIAEGPASPESHSSSSSSSLSYTSCISKDLGGSVMSIDICTEEFMDPAELVSTPSKDVDEYDCGIVKDSTLLSKALYNDEYSMSNPSPHIESNSSERESSHATVFPKVQSAPSLREATSTTLSRSKRSVRFALQGGSNVDTNFRKQGLYSAPRSFSMRNISGSMTTNQPNADISSNSNAAPSMTKSGSTSLHNPRPQIELTRTVTEPLLGKHRSLQDIQQSPSSASRLHPVRSSTIATIETRRQVRASKITAAAAATAARNDPAERPRSFSLGRMASSRKLQSWFGPLRSTGGIEGNSNSNSNSNKNRNGTPNLGMTHRHSSAPSFVPTLSLSLEDQQRLQRFREGQLAYPPPPAVSPGARMSVSYFPDLEQKEKERILNRMPHHSFSL